MVTSIQVAIAVLGRFRGDRLEDYLNCFVSSLNALLVDRDTNFNTSFLGNFTYPVRKMAVIVMMYKLGV